MGAEVTFSLTDDLFIQKRLIGQHWEKKWFTLEWKTCNPVNFSSCKINKYTKRTKKKNPGPLGLFSKKNPLCFTYNKKKTPKITKQKQKQKIQSSSSSKSSISSITYTPFCVDVNLDWYLKHIHTPNLLIIIIINNNPHDIIIIIIIIIEKW